MAQARLTASPGAPRTYGGPRESQEGRLPRGTRHRAAPPQHTQKPAREAAATPEPRRLLWGSGQMGQARPATGNTGCPKTGKPRRLGTESTGGHAGQEHECLVSRDLTLWLRQLLSKRGPAEGRGLRAPHPRAVSSGAHPLVSTVPVQDRGLGVRRRERPTSPSAPPPTPASCAPSCSLTRTISSCLLCRNACGNTVTGHNRANQTGPARGKHPACLQLSLRTVSCSR